MVLTVADVRQVLEKAGIRPDCVPPEPELAALLLASPACLPDDMDPAAQAIALLSERARWWVHRSPWRGWRLAVLAYELARQQPALRLRGQASMALACACIECEELHDAWVLLDEAQDHFVALGAAGSAACCAWQRGVVLCREGHSQEALPWLRRAVDELHDTDSTAAAGCWRDLASAYLDLGQFDAAGRYVEQALRYFEGAGAWEEWACCSLVHAQLLYRKTYIADACAVLAQVEPLLRGRGLLVEWARYFYLEGLSHRETAPPQALAWVDRARALFAALDLPGRVAWCDVATAYILTRQGEYRSAQRAAHLAYEWLARCDHVPGMIDCQMTIGVGLYYDGALQEAISAWQQALGLARQIGRVDSVAQCQVNIGLTLRELGNYSRALDYLHRAYELLRTIGQPMRVADCASNLALTSMRIARWDDARTYLEQAHAIFADHGMTLEQVWCRAQIALIAVRGGQWARALELAQEASRLADESGSAVYASLTRAALAEALTRAGRPREALAACRQARDSFLAAHNRLGAWEATLLLAENQLALRDAASAEETLGTLNIDDLQAMPHLAWQYWSLSGQLAELQGDAYLALSCYAPAVAVHRQARLTLAPAPLSAALLEAQQRLYQRAAALALRNGQADLALLVFEEQHPPLGAPPVPADRAVPARAGSAYVDGLIARRRDLLQRIAALREKFSAASLLPSSPRAAPVAGSHLTDADRRMLMDELRACLAEHERVVNQLQVAQDVPPEMALELAQPFELDYLARALNARAADWLTLVYSLAEDRLVTFAVNDSADGVTVRVWQQELSPLQQHLLELSTSPEPSFRTAMYGPDGRYYRRRLFDLLIPAEVQGTLHPDKWLLIVPHGRLHRLSFQVLEGAAGYLVQQSSIVTLPSMRTVPLFQKRAASRGTGVLVAGVSDFGGRHTSLPNATLEARAVAGLYDGPCLLLLDGEATVEALFEATSSPESGGWRIIHLATHAYFDPLDGAFSGLAMADGDLSPMDIARLRLEGAVVVLSACQTGLQDLHAGEETVGIVSALLQAGARTVISTLWHVHDTEVPWLMVDLHRGLREGLPPAAALTRVQREAIRRGVPLYHWAAFTTVGGGWLP